MARQETKKDGVDAPPDTTTKLVAAIIEVPISPEIPAREFGIHVDIRLTLAQSTALRRVTSQLDKQQAVLANGRRITHHTDAVKYLLELLDAAG